MRHLALAKVALMGGRLVVTVPVGSAAAVRGAVVACYRRHAAMRLPKRAAIWAKKMGVPVPVVLIRDQRRRCNTSPLTKSMPIRGVF